MTARDVGLLLRMLGPLIQIGCLILLFRPIDGGPSRAWLLGGFAAGLALAVLGNVLMRKRRAPNGDPR